MKMIPEVTIPRFPASIGNDILVECLIPCSKINRRRRLSGENRERDFAAPIENNLTSITSTTGTTGWGFNLLSKGIERKQVRRVPVTFKDRLARFAFEYM